MIYCPKCGGTYFIIHHTVGGPHGSVLLECCSTKQGMNEWGMYQDEFCGQKWLALEFELMENIL